MTQQQAPMTATNHLKENISGANMTGIDASQQRQQHSQHNCDILLNNFQIKKKKFRVLLNCDHIVWERLERNKNILNQNGNDGKNIKKDIPNESEQLSNQAIYSNSSNVVHINEIIRVAKGNTKASTFRTLPLEHADNFATINTGEVRITTTTTTAQNNTYGSASPSTTPTEQYLTIHYAERIVQNLNDCNRWRIRTLTLFNSDAYIVRQWHSMLMKMLKKSNHLRVKRLLVFINPYGGRKQGLTTYERFCKPLFELAGIDASCIISQRSNQIRDILFSHDLTLYDAICCVGGDGTVAEVINGLIFRTMRDLGLDLRRPAYIPKPTIPIGIIPAGSTDTVAYSLHGTSDIRTAAIHLILGQRRGLDVCSVRNRQGLIRFCVSVFSYGYLGDIAANSERYRWMGPKRYEYTGVKAFISNRGYDAEIQMLLDNEQDHQHTQSYTVEGNNINQSTTTPSDLVDTRTTISTSTTKCYANCQRCSIASITSTLQQQHQQLFEQIQMLNKSNDDVDEQPTTSSNSIHSNGQQQQQEIINITKKLNESDEVDNEQKNVNINDYDDVNCKITALVENQLRKDNEIKELLRNPDALNRARILSSPISASNRLAFLNAQHASSFSSSSSINNYGNNAGNWKTVKGNFFMVSAVNITCACSRSPNGISRYSHLGDGSIDVILVRKTSLFNNVRFALNTMGRNGDVRNLPFVEVYRTKKFTFRTQNSNSEETDYSINGSCQPIAAAEYQQHPNINDKHFSSWNCDGEVVPDLDVTMSSHCQLIDVFMRGPNSYAKPQRHEKESILCCCSKSQYE